jgi:hypothetical protein
MEHHGGIDVPLESSSVRMPWMRRAGRAEGEDYQRARDTVWPVSPTWCRACSDWIGGWSVIAIALSRDAALGLRWSCLRRASEGLRTACMNWSRLIQLCCWWLEAWWRRPDQMVPLGALAAGRERSSLSIVENAAAFKSHLLPPLRRRLRHSGASTAVRALFDLRCLSDNRR